MGNIPRKTVEDRRKILIDKLIAFNIYKKDNRHLFELSLSELEHECKTLQSVGHPHNDFGSIHWISKKS